MPYEHAADPDQLAAAVLAALASTPACRPVEIDGARRAATLLADLL